MRISKVLTPLLITICGMGITASASAESNPYLKNVHTLRAVESDKYASLALDGEGRRWLAAVSALDKKDRIIVRSYLGNEWSEPEIMSAGEGVESGPALIADSSGNLLLVWHGRRDGVWSLYERRLGKNLKWGSEKRIGSSPGNELHPQLCLDDEGRVWLASENISGSKMSINLRVWQDNGGKNSWSDPVIVYPDGQDRRPVLAPKPGGGVWLAWDSNRTGNYDIFLSSANWQTKEMGGSIEVGALEQVTADAAFDDTPSLATDPNTGDLWVAWNSMRAHSGDLVRTDRHLGDAFVRCYRDGLWLTPPGVVSAALPGQASFGAVNKSPHAAVPPKWHWKQTQSYPRVFIDGPQRRLWVVWRTDATGAHNFDLFARVYDLNVSAWYGELNLTKPYLGKDQWPSFVLDRENDLWMAWEGQAKPIDPNSSLGRGDVDIFNTKDLPNNIFVGRLELPKTMAEDWIFAPLMTVPEEVFNSESAKEPAIPGPPPGTIRTADGLYGIYFGDPHSHSVLSDAKIGWPDQILTLGRDKYGLDFAVVTDHSEMGRLQNGQYSELQLLAREFTDPGKFISFTGFEWTDGTQKYGHRVVLYKQDVAPHYGTNEKAADTIEKLYDHAREHDGLMSTHHPGQAQWGRWNTDNHDPQVEPNFEITSWHGRFEYYSNPWQGRRQVPGHQYQDALSKGYRLGAMGASDTHHLIPGQGGLTAVLAESLDRESVFEAVRSRRIYATTGDKIIIEFTINGQPMGSEIAGVSHLNLKVEAKGTDAIDRIEIVKDLVDTYAAVRVSQNPDSAEGTFVLYDAGQPAGGELLPSEDTRQLSFEMEDEISDAEIHSYYLRVTQDNTEQAWSSPIWVTTQPKMPPQVRKLGD